MTNLTVFILSVQLSLVYTVVLSMKCLFNINFKWRKRVVNVCFFPEDTVYVYIYFIRDAALTPYSA